MSAPELNQYDIPFEGVEASVIEWVKEALELRHGAGNDPDGPLTEPNPAEGHIGVMNMLVRVRQRSDRVDALLAKTTQAKARAKRAQERAQFEAEVAYNTATRGSTLFGREYTTRQEKHAEASLDSLEQRRIAHMAERVVSVTTEAYEVVNQVHWQLDSIRKDLRASLHALQFESSLER